MPPLPYRQTRRLRVLRFKPKNGPDQYLGPAGKIVSDITDAKVIQTRQQAYQAMTVWTARLLTPPYEHYVGCDWKSLESHTWDDAPTEFDDLDQRAIAALADMLNTYGASVTLQVLSLHCRDIHQTLVEHRGADVAVPWLGLAAQLLNFAKTAPGVPQ